VYFAFGFSYIIYSTFFVRHLVRSLGMETAAAGTLWLQIGLASTLSGFVWGAVSDRWGRKFALMCIFVLQGLSFLAFGLTQGVAGAYVSAALFAITAWSIPAVMAAIAGDVFGARQAPAALGLMTVLFGVGQALAPYVGGRVADATQSFAAAFVLAGLVALTLGAGGTLLLRRQ
jgi:MFS family permease